MKSLLYLSGYLLGLAVLLWMAFFFLDRGRLCGVCGGTGMSTNGNKCPVCKKGWVK